MPRRYAVGHLFEVGASSRRLTESTQRMAKSKYAGVRLERIKASKQVHDGRFQNIGGVKTDLKGLSPPLAADFLFNGKQRAPHASLPSEDPHAAWTHAPDSGLRVTWLGHSTLLLEIDGVRILTDPVFGERASPFSFAGPKRFHPVPVAIAGLPPIDVLLLSHDHYDHLCSASIRELAQRPLQVVTALGVASHLESCGMPPERIHELDWHEHIELPGVRFTATPAQHFSGRSTFDRNSTLWASWVIETANHKLFFSGDTGLFDGLAEIGQKHGPFDLTLLEIGAWHPAWGNIHLGPENALIAHEMLRGKILLPVHWGTFDLALHRWDAPAEELFAFAQAKKTRLFLPKLGQALEPTRVQDSQPWWREVTAAARKA
jgi:L-ascorbate metabolism protein UlaG (beta-lactamase superfamily)